LFKQKAGRASVPDVDCPIGIKAEKPYLVQFLKLKSIPFSGILIIHG